MMVLMSETKLSVIMSVCCLFFPYPKFEGIHEFGFISIPSFLKLVKLMAHFGEGRFIINFRIAVDKLDISGGYKRISFLLDFVTMSGIV